MNQDPGGSPAQQDAAGLAEFVAHRTLLFTVAYELLGTAADAEDVLQEVWLRWADVDHAGVRDPRAFLVRITTRLGLNRLRTLARRRETYVGEWLPEPLLTVPDVAQDVELADSLSTAMLLVLESLGGTERAVFVLREVFGFSHAEIAEAVGKSPDNVRQIARRARKHVAARRPHARVSAAERDTVLARFRAAIAGGDLQQLLDVMAPDVVLRTDGGGRVQAAINPIFGVEKVLRFLSGIMPQDVGLDPVWVNGSPGIAVRVGGVLDAVATAQVHEGRITDLYVVRNPEKLTRLDLDAPVPVSR